MPRHKCNSSGSALFTYVQYLDARHKRISSGSAKFTNVPFLDARHKCILSGSALFTIVLPAKSDSYVMFCLQSYQGLRIDISLVY